MSKVFLSYNHRDQSFVENLYRRLTADGVECFFDKESIGWGANWVVALEEGIDECQHIVLVLTPDFCASEWTKLERTVAMADDPSGLKRRLRPLLLKPCEVPRFLKPVQQIDVSSTAKFEAAYPKICRELGGTPRSTELPTDRSTIPEVSPLPEKHRMPYRSLGDLFVGRVEDLWKVHDLLNHGKTAVVQGVGVVSGTGGLGKTQLGIEYVHRFSPYYPGGVFWVAADRGRATLLEQVTRAAEASIDERLTEDEQILQLWRALSQLRPVLIVLDNFPEQSALEPWLPVSGDIHTLVTTRRRDLNSFHPLSLDFLDEGKGVELLNGGQRSFGQEARPLVRTLGGLPLALELSRNFLNLRPELTVETLLEEIERMGAIEALDRFAQQYGNELPSGHEKQVASTFQLSWDLTSEMGKSVLQVMSLLAPQPVPRRLLRKILSLPGEVGLEDELGEAITELTYNLSLAELDGETDPWVHRLVRAFVRTTLEDAEAVYEDVAKSVVEELARAREETDTASFRELEKVLPHGEEVSSAEWTRPEQMIDICNYLSWQHRKWGRYRLAEEWSRKSLENALLSLEPGHPSIATTQSYLALVLKDLGELEEARDLLREALASDQQSFEPGHPSIATSQSNLATVLLDLGELEEAQDLHREALASDQKSFELGHPNIAIRQSNLAAVLKDLGELEEARDLLREALASNQKSFEPGHPKIARRQSNLALVLKDLGELEEARDLLQRAHQSLVEALGPEHPSTKTVAGNLRGVERSLTR